MDQDNIQNEINKCKNDINYWYNNYFKTRNESGFTQTYNKTFNIIPNPRSYGFVYQKSEYIMRKTFEFLPDFLKNDIKLISDGK